MPLTLPSPNLGNINDLVSNLLIQRTLSDESIIIAPASWPQFENLIFEFGPLVWQTYQDLIVYLTTNVGQLVQMTDFESNTYMGFFADPIIEFEQNFEVQYNTNNTIESCSGGFTTKLTFAITEYL